jgi:hypothetical protein
MDVPFLEPLPLQAEQSENLSMGTFLSHPFAASINEIETDVEIFSTTRSEPNPPPNKSPKLIPKPPRSGKSK